GPWSSNTAPRRKNTTLPNRPSAAPIYNRMSRQPAALTSSKWRIGMRSRRFQGKLRRVEKAIWIEEQFARRSVSEMTASRMPLFKEILMAILGGAVLSFAYFRITDPLPFATWCWESVFKLFRKYRYEAGNRALVTEDIEPNVPPGARFILVGKGLGLK